VQRRSSLLLLLILLLGACTTSGSDTATPPDEPEAQAEPTAADRRQGGTLRIGLSSDPESIDPRFVADDEGELIVDAVFEPLVRLDPQHRVVPAAAEAWERDEDGRVWTFTLREATFHDGSPVTAHDFARAFERIADGTAEPRSFLAYLLEPVEGVRRAQEEGGDVEGVEVVDERTLRLHLHEPNPGFLRILSHPSLSPVPDAADDDLDAFAARPIGNGPFRVTEAREPGGFIRLSGVPDHPDRPRLDAVVLQIYASGDERQWDDLVDGQLQVADIPVSRIPEAVEQFGRSADGYRGPGLLSGVTSAVYLYGFDLTAAPFDDVAVRRAVSLAIDREAIVEELFPGARRVAQAIVPPSVPGSQQGVCDHCRHDPAAAAELLEEADVGLEELTLTYNRGGTHAAVAERMAADIEDALGLAVTVDGLELRDFLGAVRSGEARVFRMGLDPDAPSPGEYLHPLLHSDSIGIENLTRYSVDEVDDLLEEARTAEEDEAIELWREVEQRALDDVAVLPLFHYRHNRVVAPGVRDLYWSPFGRIDLARVWLDED
jgi:oligopeptide transport system substrate-binding protein